MTPRPPRSTLFPHTTLFRSNGLVAGTRAEPARCGGSEVLERLSCRDPPRAGDETERPRRRDPCRACEVDRKSTRLNSSHANISYAVFCLKTKSKQRLAQDLC